MKTAAQIAAERAAAASDEANEADPAKEPAEEEPAEEATPEEAPGPEEPEEPPVALTVPDLLKYFCGVLMEQAWQKLGIRMDPATGSLVQDLPQARLAIDSLAALVEQLGANLAADEQRLLNGELANLRMNYVQRSSKD